MLALIFFLLIAAVINSSISIDIKILKDNTNDEIIIGIKALYGLIRFKKEIPLVKIEIEDDDIALSISEETKVNMKDDIISEKHKSFDIKRIFCNTRRTIDIVKKYKKVLNYSIKITKWKSIYWETELGLEDAAITGFITGLLNIIKTNVLVFIKNNRISFQKVHLNAKPNFNTLIIKTTLNCIFSIKIGYIIIAGIKLIKIKYIGN